ncbi:uncharacterized protein SCHCODRAFT_02532107 [Schizophyllum commune H4-8]|uniref:uncharacterized protein n=1 Tax=Schizophyllum commune (strain H4-8 / FGSC 9210) TaxID=578458 RepID=UPI00215E1FF5|nr:uncharacterized protein SCHCODRAFT_02532107 [Schizophyllum commune H4-8]KAI5896344.1 hypothetical protein SCHCODRAFT_02532107 [Schizophyllum commune H4-8]
MPPSIPEELLHDILEHLLDFPTDAEFFVLNGRRDAKNAARWRIADPALRDLSRRPPALLLVCKAWRRVGVPLLYRTAIIRSKGQAESLTHAITALYPERARFVRRLRLEGGFGMDAFKLLKATTRLTHLAINLHVFANESIIGLCRGLQLEHVNPTVLVLADTKENSKNRAKLVDTVTDQVPRWTKLMAVHLTCIEWHLGPYTTSIVRLLANAPALHTVVMPIDGRPPLNDIRILSRNRALGCLFFTSERTFANYYHMDANEINAVEAKIAEDPRLSSICVYDTEDGKAKRWVDSHEYHRNLYLADVARRKRVPSPEPTTYASPPPMHLQPLEVQQRIWLRIFDFVKPTSILSPTVVDVKPALLSCSRVCKMWRRLALPRVYANISLMWSYKTQHLAKSFEMNPQLGRYVRTLGLNNRLRDLKDDSRDGQIIDIDAVLGNVPNLRVLSAKCTDLTSDQRRQSDALRISWSRFTSLPQLSSGLTENVGVKIPKEYAPPAEGEGEQTQEDEHFPEGSAAATTAVDTAGDKKKPAQKELTVALGPLTPFRALRVLHFHGAAKLKFKDADVPNDIFPVLEDLKFMSCHTSFLRLFNLFELPRLRKLALHSSAQTCEDAGDFLERHGPKVEELDLAFFPTDTVLELCTAMRTLHVRERKPPSKYSAAGWRSKTLSVIHFTDEMPARIQAQRPWAPVLSTIDPSKVPKLKIMHMGLLWPTDERSISSNFWIPFAESLLQKGIEIRDQDNLPWIPRLRSHRELKRKIADMSESKHESDDFDDDE